LPRPRIATSSSRNAVSFHLRTTNRLVIRVYDDAGNVIETHEHIGDFKEWCLDDLVIALPFDYFTFSLF
jgi:hypothetical protein